MSTAGKPDIVDRLRQYTKDWAVRAADATLVHEAISEIEALRASLAEKESKEQVPCEDWSET